MKFKEFAKNVGPEIQEAINENLDKGIAETNPRKAKMLPIYLNFKNMEQAKKMMWATWALAIVTIIATTINIYVSLKFGACP